MNKNFFATNLLEVKKEKYRLFLSVVFWGIYEGMKNGLVDRFEKTYFYPYPYQNEIVYYSDKYGVNPSLAAGVILAESKFLPKAQSERGAIGLMQIMPETGAWIAGKLHDRDYTVAKLYQPKTNIRYGIWYLAFLLREFHNNEVLAVAAYNAGHGQILHWQEEYHWGDDFADYQAIPFRETRHYVEKVLHNEKEYRRLYGTKP